MMSSVIFLIVSSLVASSIQAPNSPIAPIPLSHEPDAAAKLPESHVPLNPLVKLPVAPVASGSSTTQHGLLHNLHDDAQKANNEHSSFLNHENHDNRENHENHHALPAVHQIEPVKGALHPLPPTRPTYAPKDNVPSPVPTSSTSAPRRVYKREAVATLEDDLLASLNDGLSSNGQESSLDGKYRRVRVLPAFMG